MQLLLVVVGAIVVAALAGRRGLQPSLVVVVLASVVSFVPGLPRVELSPGLILSVVLPPLLYSAALDFSFVTFTRNLRPILGLGVGMVVVSTFVTGVVAWWAVPGLALAPALVLGAVVAPPDAVAALAVGRRLGLPNSLMAILTGESLVNDAAALTIFTLTVAAVTGEHTLFGNPLLLFGYGVVVGCLIGLLLGKLVHWLRLRLRDSGLETALGLLVPFAAYLLAEEVHASGVLAVVLAGFSLGHKAVDVGFATRLQGRQVWSSLDTLLETFVFAYMGLQCRFVFEGIATDGTFVLAAVLILLTVLLVRPVWVFLTYGRAVVGERLIPRRRTRTVAERMPWRHVVVISWTGMRGVVTLAAAAGIPLTAQGAPFPGRDVMQALAFVVAVGTLLIQGPTLPPLIRALHISAPGEQEHHARETRRAREISRAAAEESVRAALADPPPGADPAVLVQFKEKLVAALAARRAGEQAEEDIEAAANSRETRRVLRRNSLAAQRAALVRARDAGELDDEITRRELDRLDYEEAAAAAD